MSVAGRASAGIRQTIRDFLTLSAGEITARIVGFATSVYLARVLGSDGFGQVGFVFAVYGYFALLASPGFETVGTREVAKNSLHASEIARSLFSLRCMFSAVAFLLLLVFSFLFMPADSTRLLLVLQGLSLLLTSLSVQFLFRGINSMPVVAAAQVIQAGGYLVSTVLVVRTTEQLLFVPLCFFSASLLSVVYLRQKSKTVLGPLSFRFSLDGVGTLLGAAIPLGLSSFMVLIYYSLDSVMLGFLKGANAVGIYTAAYKIVLLVTALPAIILAAFFPSLSKEAEGKTQQRSLNQYLTVMILLGLPVGCLGYFLSPWILEVCYGKSYLEATVPLQILLFNVTFVFLSMAFANPLTAMGRNREYLRVVSWGAAVNIVLNALLIPSYGLVGAAVATLASEAVVTVEAKRQLNKLHPFQLSRFLSVPLLFIALAFGTSFGAYFLLPDLPLIAASICLALYAGLLFGSRKRVLQSMIAEDPACHDVS